MNSSRVRGRSAASTCRSSSASATSRAASTSRSAPPGWLLMPCSACAGPTGAGPRRPAARRCRGLVGVRRSAGHAVVGLAGRPAEADQRAVHLVAPAAAARRRPAGRPGVPPWTAPSRSLSSRRSAGRPSGRCRAPASSAARSSVATARRSSSGPWHGEHRLGEPRADPAGGLQQLEHDPLVLVGEAEQGQRVLADDQRGRQRGPARRAAARRGCRACTAATSPTPPTSTTALSGASAATRPARRRSSGRPPRRRGGRGVDAGLGARRARRGRSPAQRVGGVGRPGRRPSRRIRVTMAPTWALSARPLPVTAALTSLGVCSATGSPARAAATIATALAWAVPITVRTLCWAKTRSTATTSGRCSSSQAVDGPLDRQQPRPRVVARPASGRRRRRPGSAGGRALRRPRRDRSGSGRGRPRARARRTSVRTPVRDETTRAPPVSPGTDAPPARESTTRGRSTTPGSRPRKARPRPLQHVCPRVAAALSVLYVVDSASTGVDSRRRVNVG